MAQIRIPESSSFSKTAAATIASPEISMVPPQNLRKFIPIFPEIFTFPPVQIFQLTVLCAYIFTFCQLLQHLDGLQAPSSALTVTLIHCFRDCVHGRGMNGLIEIHTHSKIIDNSYY